VTFLFGAAIGIFTRRLMEWVHEEGFCDEATRDKNWVEYATMLLDGREPLAEYERVRDEVLTAFFASKTKAELFEGAVKRRVLVAPIATAADVLANPQLNARGYWETVDMGRAIGPETETGPGTGKGTDAAAAVTVPDTFPVRFPGALAKFERTPLVPLPGPPGLDEHGDEVRRARVRRPQVGVERTSAAAPTDPPLAGLKVLDLMWVMAGPAASRVLADYGAEVIRVESMHRIDTARTLAPFVGNEGDPEKSGLFNNLNGNKLDLSLDLTDPLSHEVMLDLVRWADVVVDAFSPRGMGSLGLDHETLLRLRPDLVVASTCLSGQTGPLSSLAGFGTMAAAISGFFSICGWPDRAPCGPFGAYTDYVAPRYFLCTLLAALEHRRRTGEGQYIDFSQGESSIHNLSTVLLDYVVNGRVTERMGNDDVRFAPHGVYPSLGDDQWIAIVCETDEQWRNLCGVLGGDARRLSDLPIAHRLAERRTLDELVSSWSATRPAGEAADELQAAGVPAHQVADSMSAVADPQLRHRRHFVQVPHGKLGTTWMEGSRFTLSRTPARMWRAGPTFGEDSSEILAKTLGYDADRIAELAIAGILE
jgi:crotonobetainyl-CoA:carnitine CoA-transferase CaiB-like acyl-CoA transferase